MEDIKGISDLITLYIAYLVFVFTIFLLAVLLVIDNVSKNNSDRVLKLFSDILKLLIKI